ncbi:MAG: hypothetical protein FK733_10250 [Asgard group archaeon]|nr:hypothetical protein [Asgard group archaeon]
MRSRTRNVLLIITVLTCIILNEGLMTNAMPNQPIDDEQCTPELFHIGTIYLTINVSSTEFDPADFTVQESATVNLTIRSIDINHTFDIPEYDINETILATTSVNFAFVADKLGEFTYSSDNSSATGTMTVTDPYVPDMPRPENINILFDLAHIENTSYIKDVYGSVFNWTVDSGFSTSYFESDQITPAALQGIELLVILEPDENFTTAEISDITKYIREGGSLLIGGSVATASTNVYEITEKFGFGFIDSAARYIVDVNNTLAAFNVTDFEDHPIINENEYVPLTDDIISMIQYTGNVLDFNATLANELIPHDNLTDSDHLVDAYPILKGNDTIFADADGNLTVGVNETVGENNTLIAAAETAYNGRVFGVGSADFFNNSMVGRNLGNQYLFERTIQWLTKMYSILQTNNYDISTYELKIGENINVTLAVYAQNLTETDAINISVNVWRNQKIESTVYLQSVNDSYFEGQIITRDDEGKNLLKSGTYSVQAVAHKRGYGYNLTSSYYIEIEPAEPSKLPVPIPYIITYVASILIGIVGISFFFIRVLRAPKIEAVEEESETEVEEEDEDLEEYETDELEEYETDEESE